MAFTVLTKQEFLSNFHALSGTTVGERCRSFQNLLRGSQCPLSDSPDQPSLSFIRPKTYLETVFKADLALHLRSVPDLMEILLSDNQLLINKILQSSPAFIVQHVLKDVTGEQLAEELFPRLSYNTKTKLLNKLALHLRDESKADDYFAAIKAHYGVYFASKLLSCCSKDLIVDCVQSNRIEMTPKQLLVIIKRFPEMTEQLFETLCTYKYKALIGVKYEYVMKYLARYDPPLFLKLNRKYMTYVRLGNRSTRKMILLNRQEIVERPKEYYELLKRRQIQQCTGSDFPQLYRNLFPKSLTEFRQDLSEYLALLRRIRPTEKRLKLLLESFRMVYGSELWDHPDLVQVKLIKMMSPDEREAWLKTHEKPDRIPDEVWIGFSKTDKSIPELKQKMSYTTKLIVKAKLASALVTTCKMSGGESELLEVCRYMLEEHGHDHSSVHIDFLRTVEAQFDVSKLGHEFWTVMQQFLQIFAVASSSNLYYIVGYEENYIHYRLRNGLPVDEQLADWARTRPGRYWLCQNEPKFEKHCLLAFKDLIPLGYQESGSAVDGYLSYLEALFNWNRKEPRDPISPFICQEGIDCLRNAFEANENAYRAIILATNCILFDYKKSEEVGLLGPILQRDFSYRYNLKIIKRLAKEDPRLLRKHLDAILTTALRHHTPPDFLKILFRSYDHLGIPQEICAASAKAVRSQDPNDYQKIKNALVALSHLWPPERTLGFVESYHREKPDPTVLLLLMYQAMLPCLRNLIPQRLAVDTVAKFCQREHLRSIQGALYSVAHNVAEDELAPFLFELNAKDTVVRKHAIFLEFKVLSKQRVYETLSKFMETDQDASIRKSLFKGIFNFFLRNPDDYAWALTKQAVRALDLNDSEAFNVLTRCRRMPERYFVRYSTFTWNVLKDVRNLRGIVGKGKSRILDAIDRRILPSLPPDFYAEVITKDLFKASELTKLEESVQGFACRCIIYVDDSVKQQDLLRVTFEVLKTYIRTTWRESSTRPIATKMVYHFVKHFCSYYLKNGATNRDVLVSFIRLWGEILKPCQAMDDYLHLQFTLLHLDARVERLALPEIARNVAKLCNTFYEQGSLIVGLFHLSLKPFLREYFQIGSKMDAEENHLIFTEGVLKTGGLGAALLAICLLPDDYLAFPKLRPRYDAITDEISRNEDPLVQERFHYFLLNTRFN